MGWFNRLNKGINTDTKDKKVTKEGLWYKCPECKKIAPMEEHVLNLKVCDCGYHDRMNTLEYFNLLFDNNEFKELDPDLRSDNPLNFVDKKKYDDRLRDTEKKTGLKDAITTAHGKIDNHDIVIASMNFEFIGGSMGSVVGEKIARAIDYSIENRFPFMIISKSGGARMMEAAFSLMQMAKTSAKLNQLSDAKLPYISLMLDPTTGGVTASYAMLGDINIAEPGALIGFAGPRVIRETIGRDLPEGFQRAEFLLEHGFLDYIVNRKNLKTTLAKQLKLFAN
ncbi:MAG: acetyl-CoA carboxylase carboxyltransferase subunit beta [Bacteroidales bacterium]|nr:acetyl-CoA carboxylase carboxyltransferase subunit beta [Bacteroidales bacterium]MBN2758151.1 acetyl-CoA carboxylase carboxyltransferase subunit beta [Bacteroidales bacterium]